MRFLNNINAIQVHGQTQTPNICSAETRCTPQRAEGCAKVGKHDNGTEKTGAGASWVFMGMGGTFTPYQAQTA
jgi:hypothetical protein